MTTPAQQLSDLYAKAVQTTLKNPAWFFDNILNFPALPWQLEAVNAVLDVQRKIMGLPTVINHEGLPRITIRSCHGTGKTQMLAMIMHLWNFTNRGKIACTAPKEAQLLKRLLPRYRVAMRRADEDYKRCITVQGKEIKCFGDPDWGAVMETASDPDNLAGYHDTPQLFLIDEASAKRLDPMFPVIEGALTTPGSVSVEIGNPTRMDGEFYNHHCKSGVKELYYRMHIKPEDAPELINPRWKEAMAQKYGINSPVYLVRVLGEFASFDEYLLIPPEYIEDAMDDERAEDGSLPKLRVTVDVSDGGEDSTVITVARHYDTFIQVLHQKAYWYETGKAVIQSARDAVSTFLHYGGRPAMDDFVVDGLGVGAGTVGKILEMGYNVINFKGGEQSIDPNRWRNKRVESYISMYNAFKDGLIAIAPGCIDDEDDFRAHLLSIKRNPDSDKFDDIMPKRTILKSPDRADSLMMQFADRTHTPTDHLESPITLLGTTQTAGYDAGLV